MDVVLLKDVDKLGLRGEVVSVSRGYMRNYLQPRRLAQQASPAIVAEVQRRDAERARHEARTAEQAETIAETLRKTVLRFEVNAGPQGTLFGSVTPTDIAEEIWRTRKVRVDRRKIDLPDPIKRIGRYEVPIVVFEDVRVDVKTLVVPLGGELPPEEELEQAEGEARGDRDRRRSRARCRGRARGRSRGGRRARRAGVARPIGAPRAAAACSSPSRTGERTRSRACPRSGASTRSRRSRRLDDLVVRRALVEAREERAGLVGDDGDLVILARERAHRVERLPERERPELEALLDLAPQEVDAPEALVARDPREDGAPQERLVGVRGLGCRRPAPPPPRDHAPDATRPRDPRTSRSASGRRA